MRSQRSRASVVGQRIKFGKIGRFVLFGGGVTFARFALQLTQSCRALLAVTSERHLGEPLVGSETTLQRFLQEHQLPFIVSDDVNTDDRVKSHVTPDALGLSFGAAWIFKTDVIASFQGRLLNSHGSRLPQDRGGGGFSWRILRNDRQGFSVIHQVDNGIDTGPIVAHRSYMFPYSCRIPADYQEHAAIKNLELLTDFVADVDSQTEFDIVSQPEYLSTYWPRLSSDIHGYIDWSWKADEIENFICAFDDPYPGAITFIDDRRVRLKKCVRTTGDGSFHPFQYGIVYRRDRDAVYVAANGGSLVVRSVVDDAGTDVTVQLRAGDRFHTSSTHLDEARRRRVIYTPTGLKVQP